VSGLPSDGFLGFDEHVVDLQARPGLACVPPELKAGDGALRRLADFDAAEPLTILLQGVRPVVNDECADFFRSIASMFTRPP
jgi:hypothetical protein